MHVFDSGLRFYRKTVKRFRPVHLCIHWLMTHTVIPAMERISGFRTIPDDPFWFRLELLTGRHEIETIRHIDQLVQPGMTILDIGAHVGYYTRRCARLVGAEGQVIAFEPHPRIFGILCQNVAALENVTPLQVAVSENEGTADLYDYLMMSASGSLHYDESMLALQKSQLSESDIAPRIARDFPIETFTVRTRPVDVCLAELDITRVDVVKMDIEGAELGAMRGMKATIARSPALALVMEYNPQALQSFGFVPEEALAEIVDLGFRRVRIIKSDGQLIDVTDDKKAIKKLTTHLMEHMGVVNMLLTR